ncbi:MAG: hypothetical protein ACTTH6_01930 [Candidatus Altimarinota bacterium]
MANSPYLDLCYDLCYNVTELSYNVTQFIRGVTTKIERHQCRPVIEFWLTDGKPPGN